MHASHVPSTTYRHKTLRDYPFADGKQLPNRFFLGDNRVNPDTGAEEVSVWQEEQVDPSPVWWEIGKFSEKFEKIPSVG